jgi:hypothetical protein
VLEEGERDQYGREVGTTVSSYDGRGMWGLKDIRSGRTDRLEEELLEKRWSSTSAPF